MTTSRLWLGISAPLWLKKSDTPHLAADQPQAPPGLRAALRTIDQHIGTYITH